MNVLSANNSEKAFQKEFTTRANEPLQLVHADVCRPIKPSPFGKNCYFLIFIDGSVEKLGSIF